MIASRLRLGSGVGASERPAIVARLTALGASLRSVPDRYIDLESRLADRGGGNQRVTLECLTTRAPRLLATSTARVLPAALDEVRDELIRQPDAVPHQGFAMLNWFEQRQLRAIERCLETDDPVLADRIRNTGPTSSPGNGLRHLSAMAGAALAVVGLVVSPLLAMLGMSVAAVAFSLRLALRWVDRERDGERSTPDQDGA